MFPVAEYILEVLWPQDSVWGRVGSVAVAIATTWLSWKLYGKIVNKNKKFRVSNFPHKTGVLVLHQFSRGKHCPNLSPFALKVETFLRLSDIPYTIDCTVPFGPKGKCPWVNMADGTPVGDSQFIIRTLLGDTEAKLTLDGGLGPMPPGDLLLTPRERGAMEGIRLLVEEQLFWCVIYWRYYLDRCKVFLTTQRYPRFLNFMFPLFMGRGTRKKAVWQGIGLHTPDQVYDIARSSCRALDDYLGDSVFFCGLSPGTADCAVFGGLAQIMWNAPNTRYQALVTEVYPRLSSYCNRMKEKVYPDWEIIIQEKWAA